MALNLNQIINLLVKKKSESNLVEAFTEYSILKQKLEDKENQSWYFKKGIEKKIKEMSSLRNHLEKIRELFNESTINILIDKINQNNLSLSASKGKYKAMIRSSTIRENNFYNELISLKSKTELLMPIDFYLDNPEEFLKLID